jgi:hypothetical protein
MVHRKLIPVTTFTSARTGTLSIRVSSGKKVIIDWGGDPPELAASRGSVRV